MTRSCGGEQGRREVSQKMELRGGGGDDVEVRSSVGRRGNCEAQLRLKTGQARGKWEARSGRNDLEVRNLADGWCHCDKLLLRTEQSWGRHAALAGRLRREMNASGAAATMRRSLRSSPGPSFRPPS